MRAIFALLLIWSAASSQTPEVLVHQDFETGALGWSTMGVGSSLRVTRDPGQVHAGSGSLAFTYEVKRALITAAVVPASPAMARMQRLRFWVKTDRDTPAAVLLSEIKPGGGNYTAWFWAPANTWRQIELTAADFVLAEGPQDPKDADGKLDLDQLQGIGILDLGSFFPAVPTNTGIHTMFTDDFEILGGAAPAAPSSMHTSMHIDNFDRGFLPWITSGVMQLKLAAEDNPLHEPALEASYQQTEAPLPVLVRRIGNFDLAKAVRLDFDVASDEEITLLVALEVNHPGAAQGPRFTLPIYAPGKREVFHVSVHLDNFQGQGELDRSQLKTLILTDPAGAGDGVGIHNRVWIGKVEFRSAQ